MGLIGSFSCRVGGNCGGSRIGTQGDMDGLRGLVVEEDGTRAVTEWMEEIAWQLKTCYAKEMIWTLDAYLTRWR